MRTTIHQAGAWGTLAKPYLSREAWRAERPTLRGDDGSSRARPGAPGRTCRPVRNGAEAIDQHGELALAITATNRSASPRDYCVTHNT